MRVGYAYVVGDLVHSGHIRHLRNCKALCDFLIVGVLTKEAVLEKKPAPVLDFKERVDIISELRSVDAVVAQETYSPEGNVNDIRPDVLFESSSHDSPTINKHGRTLIMPYFPGQSSTNIKNQIRK